MKITFLGAANTVTGSCFLVETQQLKFLVDCGLYQGHANENMNNANPFPVNPGELDYVLLTHCHIDHSGKIPKLYLDGFKGKVITTFATKELCSIMLPDSGHIQEFENEWMNRKRLRAGKKPIKPLYTFQDAVNCLSLFEGIQYDEVKSLDGEIKVRFRDAGHTLGSAIIEIWFQENGEEVKVVFSGDLGNKGLPILRDPSIIEDADFLVLESTYGNRLHMQNNDKIEKFLDIINETIEKGGNVVIPSFAVGRTQEILYDLNKHRDLFDDKIQKMQNVPVIVDSPLAISATEVFRHHLECFDEEAQSIIAKGDNPLDFEGLKFTRTSDESKALNDRKESMVIISASGMCEAGRIKHHLKHNLWRNESTILFVGYQAEGTLGRKLVEGAKLVRIFGEDISVNARVESIDGFSGHADMNGLIEWIDAFQKKPRKIFLVHGDESVIQDFSKTIKEKLNIETITPRIGSCYQMNLYAVTGCSEGVEKGYSYKQLALLDLMDTLKAEFDEISEILKSDLKKGLNGKDIEQIRSKLMELEKAMVNVIK